MRKLDRFAALVSCAAALTFPAIATAQTAEVSDRIREVGKDLGFEESDVDRLAKGEIVARDLKEGSKKELALAVAMVVKAPFSEVSDWIQKGSVDRVDQTILSHGEIPDGAVSADSLASLKLAPGELDKLLKVEPGSDFNLSRPEVEMLQSVATASESAPMAKRREAILQGYREILAERVNAYRNGGLAGIAPYTRGGDEAQPGKELTLAIEEMKFVEKRGASFYRAFKNFPADVSDTGRNLFTWQVQSIQERPTVALVHRLFEKHDEFTVAGRRAFFVGQSFNSLQLIAGAFPFGEETLIFYTNRTFTDQVAGFGSGTKHTIGRKMMLGEVEKLFKEIRASF